MQVRDRLVAACEALGVRFVYNASVESIMPPQQASKPAGGTAAAASSSSKRDSGSRSSSSSNDEGNVDCNGSSRGSSDTSGSSRSSSKHGDGNVWRLGMASGGCVTANAVVLSTGGLSFPVVGTDGTGLRLLCGVGHNLSGGSCYAALTPLRGRHPGGQQLAGESGLLNHF